MKLFSLILSILVFFATLYFFLLKLGGTITTFDDYIYISLLVLLMVICITGVVINWSILLHRRKRVVTFVSNSFSKRKAA